MDGGYDEGYRACPCFWGSNPSSLVYELVDQIGDIRDLRVLDAGCGEGKNSIHLGAGGAQVTAYDVSSIAIEHATLAAQKAGLETIRFFVGDVREQEHLPGSFDIVIAYGLFHCLKDADEVRALCRSLQNVTAKGGYFVLCAFNDRAQDLSAHPGFNPTLLAHEEYVSLFGSWDLLQVHDRDLFEVHPHNNIPHSHSMTRILARKSINEDKR